VRARPPRRDLPCDGREPPRDGRAVIQSGSLILMATFMNARRAAGALSSSPVYETAKRQVSLP
jgi:hypothetical protein